MNIPLVSLGRKRQLRTLALLSGILGPAIIGAGMLIAALAYSGQEGEAYNLLNHFVSELGELGVSELAFAFNWGLILGGSITAFFMVYLALQLQGWIRVPMVILGLATAVSGALVGVYPMNNLAPHIVAALSFFNLGMLISFLYSILIMFSKKQPFPRWLALPGLFNAAAFILFLYFPTNDRPSEIDFQEGMRALFAERPDLIPMAALEWVVVLGILAWVLTIAIYLSLNRVPDSEVAYPESLSYKAMW
jgi:hypothetical protein